MSCLCANTATPLQRCFWRPPRAWCVVEDSESPEECAQRELQEEIGYAASDFTKLGTFWPSPGFCDELMHAFLARGLVPSRLEADEDENIEVVRYPVARVVEMVRTGEIRDAKTIVAVLLAASVVGGTELDSARGC